MSSMIFNLAAVAAIAWLVAGEVVPLVSAKIWPDARGTVSAVAAETLPAGAAIAKAAHTTEGACPQSAGAPTQSAAGDPATSETVSASDLAMSAPPVEVAVPEAETSSAAESEIKKAPHDLSETANSTATVYDVGNGASGIRLEVPAGQSFMTPAERSREIRLMAEDLDLMFVTGQGR